MVVEECNNGGLKISPCGVTASENSTKIQNSPNFYIGCNPPVKVWFYKHLIVFMAHYEAIGNLFQEIKYWFKKEGGDLN